MVRMGYAPGSRPSPNGTRTCFEKALRSASNRGLQNGEARNLWSAIRNQRIAKYTRDPGAGGYGIYLVFSFGNDPDACQPPESGTRPKNAAELEERLRGTLTSEEARLISICVIDVARP